MSLLLQMYYSKHTFNLEKLSQGMNMRGYFSSILAYSTFIHTLHSNNFPLSLSLYYNILLLLFSSPNPLIPNPSAHQKAGHITPQRGN